MARNKKGDRFLVNRNNLERLFSRPNPNFHDAWLLTFLYVTGSDRLSHRNIMVAERYAYRLREIPEWQNVENIEKLQKLDDAVLRAKERFANRKSRYELRQERLEKAAIMVEERKQRKAALAEEKAKKEVARAEKEAKRAAKQGQSVQSPSPAKPEIDPSTLWR